MTPAVDDDGDVSVSELYVHDTVDERIDARPGPERQRRHHVHVAVETGSLVSQVGDGVRQVSQNEREKHGENHVQRMRPAPVARCRR